MSALQRKARPTWAGAILLALIAAIALVGMHANSASAVACGATCYVNAVTGSDANDGSTPATAFKTIQKGVDSVDPGGQVIVAAGNYQEDVVISQSLRLTGPNVGIPGNGARGPEATARSAAVASNDVTVDGFRFFKVANGGVAVLSRSNVTVRNNHLDGNSAIAVTCVNNCLLTRNLVNGSAAAMFLVGFGISVTDNEVRNNAGSGVFAEIIVAAGTSNLVITDNNFHDNGTVGESTISLTSASNTTISRNRIESLSAGVLLTLNTTGTTIENNHIDAADFAVAVGSLGNSGIALRKNAILTGGIKLFAPVPDPVDATLNWWGDLSGPSGDGPGTGAAVEANGNGTINFSPWVCLGTDTDTATPGFQPNLTLTSPCDTSAPVATITFRQFNGLPFQTWPGGWNTSRSEAVVTCQDPESGIDVNFLPRIISFLDDGEYTVNPHGDGSDPMDLCRNRMGQLSNTVPSAPVTLRIDRRAPTCVSTPAVQYITKNTGFVGVTIPVTTQDGVWTGGETKKLIGITGDRGATPADWTGFALGTDDTAGNFNTAVRSRTYTLTYEVKDLAGNVGSCVSRVRVTS